MRNAGLRLWSLHHVRWTLPATRRETSAVAPIRLVTLLPSMTRPLIQYFLHISIINRSRFLVFPLCPHQEFFYNQRGSGDVDCRTPRVCEKQMWEICARVLAEIIGTKQAACCLCVCGVQSQWERERESCIPCRLWLFRTLLLFGKMGL